MVWRASAPEDNDVWLSIKHNTVKLMLAQNGQLKAGVQFDVDPKQTSPYNFANASPVTFEGPLFNAFKVLPEEAADQAERLERFVWMARTCARDAVPTLSVSAHAVSEALRFGTEERHAQQVTQTIQKLATQIFTDSAVVAITNKVSTANGFRP